jgi:heme-degrading monooxygenase HmoA
VGPKDADVTVVSVLRVPVRAGSEAELAKAYETLEIFARARESGGFLGGRLLQPLSAGASFLVVAEWEDAAAYERWLSSPVRADLGRELEPLLDGSIEGSIYEAVIDG